MPTQIEVSGYDLHATIASLKERGGIPWAMETVKGRNARYRLRIRWERDVITHNTPPENFGNPTAVKAGTGMRS